jgi:carboxyl-terminal processing protease
MKNEGETNMDEHSSKQRYVRRKSHTRPMPAAVVAIGLVVVLGLGYIAGTFNTQIMAAIAPVLGIKSSSATLNLSSLQTTYRQLKANYDGSIDDAQLIEGANRGLVDALGDEYTVFLNATESTNFNNDLSGTIGGGIGVELNTRTGQTTVVRVLADNPAEKVGLAVGDVITKINDVAIAPTETLTQTVMKIHGEVGTTVKLTIARGEEIKDFTITRANVTNPSVYSSVSDGVGVMTVTRFDDQTGRLAREVARSFKDRNVQSVILDLRGNGGGFLTAAQDVAGIWLDNKVVVTEKTNDTVVDQLKSSSNPILAGTPTLVLVNGSSASASEIVAGALQDYGAAKLVGEKTFGKGSVQKLISLPGGAELKVTIARWFTPNGKNISKQGISVDKEVTISPEDITASRDPQLEAAKALLR